MSRGRRARKLCFVGLPLLFIASFASPLGGEPPVCTDDMIDMGGYCIDKQQSKVKLSWFDAMQACHVEGKRLCTNEEWLQACDGSPINEVEDMPGTEPQWLENWVYETSTEVFTNLNRGFFRCTSTSRPWPDADYRKLQKRWFHCCR